MGLIMTTSFQILSTPLISIFGIKTAGNGRETGASGSDVDSSENMYLSASGNVNEHKLLIFKIDSSKNIIWQREIIATNFASVTATQVDAFGNVYMLGSDPDFITPVNYVLTKYNSSGTPQWQRRLAGISNANSSAAGLAVSSAGLIWVAFPGQPIAAQPDIVLIKFDTDANILWTKGIKGSFDINIQNIITLNVDSADNVYVALDGSAVGGVFKFNAAGVRQYAKSFNDPASSIVEQAADVVVNASGDVYISVIERGVNNNAFLLKFDSTGVLQWQRRIDDFSENLGLHHGAALSLDSSGNIYMVGQNANNAATNGIVIVKFDSTGVLQWQRLLNDVGAQAQITALEPTDIHVEGSTTFVFATRRDPFGRLEAIVIRVPSDGTGVGTFGDWTYAASSLIEAAGDRIVTDIGGLTEVGTGSLTNVAGFFVDNAGTQTIETFV